MNGQSAGFTIIEAMLFLGMTGMLFLMVFIGAGSMASRQRFTDSTDNLQAFFQSQYDQVVTGVNTRDSTTSCASETIRPGASKDCLLLGKLIVKQNSTTLNTYYIVSTTKLPDAYAGVGVSDTDKLKNVTLEVISDSATYELKWGAEIDTLTRSTSLPSGSGRGNVNAIAYMRVPDSERIIALYYDNIVGPSMGLQWVLNNDVGTGSGGAYNPPGSTTIPSLVVCLKNDADFTASVSRIRSALYFSQGQGTGNIATNYNPGTAICP